jgi:PAS domain S-box-containing protein
VIPPSTPNEIANLQAEVAALRQQITVLVGEARLRAAELAVIHGVGQAMAAQLDTQAVIDLVGDAIGRVFDAQSVQIILYEPATGMSYFRYFNDHGARRTLDPVPLGQGFTSRIIESQQPLLINREMEAMRVALKARAFVGAAPRSYLGVPIQMGERVTGVIALTNVDREDAYDDEDIRLLTTMAANMGVAIENARLFEETQRQKQYFESLVQNSPVAIVTTGLDGNITSWNPMAERLFGYTRAEAMGQPVDALITNETQRDEARRFTAQTSTGTPLHAFTKRICKDGDLVDVEILALPVIVNSRQTGNLTIYNDTRDVGQVIAAAAAVESGMFEPASLAPVAARTDALGRLARTFQRMVQQVYAREQTLRREIAELRIEIDVGRTAKSVEEITESDYFQALEAKVDQLRLGENP